MDNDTVQRFEGRPPAGRLEIDSFEKQSGLKLPEKYSQFLKKRNRGCGVVGANYIDMWSVDKLVDDNRNYGVDEYAPDLLPFAADDGGERFAFGRRCAECAIVKLPFIPSDIKESATVAPDFGALFDTLAHRGLTNSD